MHFLSVVSCVLMELKCQSVRQAGSGVGCRVSVCDSANDSEVRFWIIIPSIIIDKVDRMRIERFKGGIAIKYGGRVVRVSIILHSIHNLHLLKYIPHLLLFQDQGDRMRTLRKNPLQDPKDHNEYLTDCAAKTRT
jgi:hypothetical protein